MAFSDVLRPLVYRSLGQPHKMESAVPAIKLAEFYEVTPDRALAIATRAARRATVYRIQYPAYGGAYVVELTDPNDRIVGDRYSVTIDPHSGVILRYRSPKDIVAGDRVLVAIEKLHTGALLGTAAKAALCLASSITLLMFGSGAVMLWHRTVKTKQHLFR